MTEAEVVLSCIVFVLFVLDILNYALMAQNRNMILGLEKKLAEHFSVVHPDEYERKSEK